MSVERERKPLVIIAGPTAVGKSGLSIRLAKETGGEIISADSMQVYRGMDVGSAKITPRQMQGVPHRLLDEFSPLEECNVTLFQQRAKEYIRSAYERGKLPILVGGTGFYIQAVLYDIDFTRHGGDEEYRAALSELMASQGPEALYRELQRVDPQAALDIHKNNAKRVMRALEYYHQTGETISEHNKREREKKSPYVFAYFVLNEDRRKLYERIDRRVDRMLEDGLMEEVRALRDMGCTGDMVSMQGLGYKEMLSYLDGAVSLEEAVYRMKRDTRRYAKRQLTWFKRERDAIWIEKEDFGEDEEAMASHMLAILRERGIINV